MKRLLVTLLIVLLLSVFTMVGCVKSTPAPAPSPAPAPTPAAAPAATPAPIKTLEIKFSHQFVAGSEFEQFIFQPMIDQINGKSKGRLHVTMYGGASLGKPTDFYDMTKEGVVELAYITPAYTPSLFPLTDVLGLPLTFPNTLTAGDSAMAAFDRFLNKEYTDVKCFGVWGTGDSYPIATKPIKTLENMKGLKIRSIGGIMSDALAALGATPVTMALPDVYMSMATGVVDGGCLHQHMWHMFKFQEVADYATLFGLGTGVSSLVMNLKTWNSLSDDLKDIVNSACRYSAYLNYTYPDVNIVRDEGEFKSSGSIYMLPKEEQDRWYAALKPVVNKWVTDLEAKGIPAKQAMAIFKEECEKRVMYFPY